MATNSYKYWLDSIFLKRESYDIAPENTVRYITQLYRNHAQYLSDYSDTQVANGLYDILSPTGFGYIGALMDDGVELGDKLDCLNSIVVLFEEYMAEKCDNILFHTLKVSSLNLNQVCYMWWDIAQIYPAKGMYEWGEDFDGAVLGTMKRILDIDSVPCQESALHGLGHWESKYSVEVAAIIDNFIKTKPTIPSLLSEYALNAKEGMIV